MQYAVDEGDGHLIADPSWCSVADVIGTYHGGFAVDGRVTGTLLCRESDDDEWAEVAMSENSPRWRERRRKMAAGYFEAVEESNDWTQERDDILARFTAELAKATGDGSRKRRSGQKPPWYQDDAHEGAIFSHLTKWKRGELVDPDSGAHTLVHLAWRALAIACQETGNIPRG